jgi:hypothetical protein
VRRGKPDLVASAAAIGAQRVAREPLLGVCLIPVAHAQEVRTVGEVGRLMPGQEAPLRGSLATASRRASSSSRSSSSSSGGGS